MEQSYGVSWGRTYPLSEMPNLEKPVVYFRQKAQVDAIFQERAEPVGLGSGYAQ